jgi:hypothetical protein
MSIEFIALTGPIVLGTMALILGLLLVSQVNQQQKKRSLGKRVSVNHCKAKSNVDQTNLVARAGVAFNAIAQILAFVLVQSGLPQNEAYFVSYCVVIPIGALLIRSAIIEQGDNGSTPKSTSTRQTVNYQRQVKAERLEEYKKRYLSNSTPISTPIPAPAPIPAVVPAPAPTPIPIPKA